MKTGNKYAWDVGAAARATLEPKFDPDPFSPSPVYMRRDQAEETAGSRATGFMENRDCDYPGE